MKFLTANRRIASVTVRGPSESGKSTIAYTFHAKNRVVMIPDAVVVRCTDDIDAKVKAGVLLEPTPKIEAPAED